MGSHLSTLSEFEAAIQQLGHTVHRLPGEAMDRLGMVVGGLNTIVHVEKSRVKVMTKLPLPGPLQPELYQEALLAIPVGTISYTSDNPYLLMKYFVHLDEAMNMTKVVGMLAIWEMVIKECRSIIGREAR